MYDRTTLRSRIRGAISCHVAVSWHYTETKVRACVRTYLHASNQPRTYETFAFSGVTDTWCVDDRAMRRNMESVRLITTCHAKRSRVVYFCPMIKYRRIPTPREGYDHLRYANIHTFFFRAEGGRAIRRKRQMASRPSGEDYLRGESRLPRPRPKIHIREWTHWEKFLIENESEDSWSHQSEICMLLQLVTSKTSSQENFLNIE